MTFETFNKQMTALYERWDLLVTEQTVEELEQLRRDCKLAMEEKGGDDCRRFTPPLLDWLCECELGRRTGEFPFVGADEEYDPIQYADEQRQKLREGELRALRN